MRISAFVISLFVVLFLPVMAYSHCHNDASYENPMTVRGNKVWDPAIINDDDIYEVEYRVNSDRDGEPGLLTDTKKAAKAWSKISFQNRTIAFQYTYAGRTDISEDDIFSSDDKNIVGWSSKLGGRQGKVASAGIWAVGNRIVEVDIGLNYYKDFTSHANRAANPGYFCLRDVLAHEFGHMAGLMDVYYNAGWPDQSRWCEDYQYYTMNGITAGGEHFREDLRCEDKYALDQKYRVP